MNLFIDTNIYLSFYHFSSDDLDELNKLAIIMAERKVTLYLPDQVLDEFQRNREVKISQSLKHLKTQKLNLQFPQLCKDYPEYKTMRDSQRQFDQAHSDLLKKLSYDITARTLKADKSIDMLFKQAKKISTTPGLIEKARLRVEIGKPPGKKGSLGDAINWESLLSEVPSNELHFVSDDGDFCSAIDDNLFSEYLKTEWQNKKGTTLSFFKRLSQFFKDTLPDIKLSGELEKEILIRRLAASSSFSETHSVLAKLSSHTGFTNDQLNAILDAYVCNSQVHWILSDPDVRKFIDCIVVNNQSVLDPEKLRILNMLIAKEDSPPVVNTDILEPPPF